MILLAKIGVGLAGTVLVGGAAICSEGFVQVKVHEKQAQGTNISLLLPAAIAPLALEFVPSRNLAQAAGNLRPYLPVVDAAIPGLLDCQDGVLVEVIDPESHVVIAKAGDSIVVDVNDKEDVVHVSVPLRAAQQSIHEIADAGGGLI